MIKERYVKDKIVNLCHVEHNRETIRRMNAERKYACIMNTMRLEIERASIELERRITKMLGLTLRENEDD